MRISASAESTQASLALVHRYDCALASFFGKAPFAFAGFAERDGEVKNLAKYSDVILGLFVVLSGSDFCTLMTSKLRAQGTNVSRDVILGLDPRI
ncbi:hypothetical protein A8L48_19760 [Rhizobium rhizogenes]|nr:hypothetical protein B0909_08460 [Rhizobium rhizogenes]OAM65272.1 hypothetical protein A8L48_19760 [Rhizobium rhizogenes]